MYYERLYGKLTAMGVKLLVIGWKISSTQFVNRSEKSNSRT